jgi:hypothetical protein
MSDTDVVRDTVDERPERTLASERRECTQDSHQDVLKQILPVGLLAGVAGSEAPKAGAMIYYHGLEQLVSAFVIGHVQVVANRGDRLQVPVACCLLLQCTGWMLVPERDKSLPWWREEGCRLSRRVTQRALPW